MKGVALSFSLALTALCLTLAARPSLALAQPRAASVLLGMDRSPAVLLDGDRAWIAGAEHDALPSALCTELMCRPVVRAEACVTPRCPGPGRMVFTSERIADVPRWPEDRAGFETAQAALYGEPSLAPLTHLFLPHPEPPPAPPRPARFSHGREDRWRLELLMGGGIATGLVHISQPMWQLDLSIGFRFVPGGMEDGLDVIYGNQFGFEARVHVLGNVTGQRDDDLAIFMGLGPGFSFVLEDEAIRIPPAMTWIVPEFGVVVRTDRVPPAAYAAWSLPIAFLIDEHVGVEARASIFLIDDWYPGDDAEVLASLSAQLLFR